MVMLNNPVITRVSYYVITFNYSSRVKIKCMLTLKYFVEIRDIMCQNLLTYIM